MENRKQDKKREKLICIPDYYPELCFLKMDIDKDNTLDIISTFLQAYEDTDQDTEEFALEFEVLTRYLLQGYILFTPQHLTDYVDLLEPMLTEEQYQQYKEAYISFGGEL